MTVTVSIDHHDAIRLLREVVKGKEDFIYISERGRCFYTKGDCPSCLIGYALVRGGVPIEMVKLLDNNSISSEDADAIPMIIKGVTQEAAHVFNAAQVVQDDDHTWGEALDAAEDYYREHYGTTS